MGFFLIIIGLLLFAIVIYQKQRKKKGIDRKTPVFTPKVQTPSYDPKFVQNPIFQILESMQIMTTTKNIDIVIGRYENCKTFTSKLSPYCEHKRYPTDIYAASDRYKELYYDKLITIEQAYVCQHPKDKKYLDEFYRASLLRCLKEAADLHLEAIDGMKQKKAINNRYLKILELIETVEKAMPPFDDDDMKKEYETGMQKFKEEITNFMETN